MKLGVCVLSLSLAIPLQAQLVPPGLQESIVALTGAIESLQTVLNGTNQDLGTYLPEFISTSADVGTQINALSSSTSNVYNLASSNLPGVQDSLAKAANALETIGNFSTTVQNSYAPMAFAVVGVLATGIVLGQGLFVGIKCAIKAIRAHYKPPADIALSAV